MRIIYLLSTLMVVGLIHVSCTKDETQTPPEVVANPLQLWTLNHYCLSVAHAVDCLEPKTFDGLTFDWLNLKRHPSIPANWQSSIVGQTYANEVGNLLRRIFDGLDCSLWRNPAHTQDVFETTSTFEKEHAYLTRVAKCSAIQQWDLNKIVQSVGRMYPVIIAAKQYFYSDSPTSPSTREVTFVVDGYFSCKSKYNGRPNDTYLHVVFPINYKLCNGYYLCDRDQKLDMDIMLTDQTNYEMRSSDMKLITDIHL